MCDNRDETLKLGMHVFACSRRGPYAESKADLGRHEPSVACRSANMASSRSWCTNGHDTFDLTYLQVYESASLPNR